MLINNTDRYDNASYILMLTANAVEPQKESLPKCILQNALVHLVAYLSLVFIVLGLDLFYSF